MEENILVTGEPLSEEKFRTPSKEFGIMPFWFWNGEMSYDEIEYQIREYKAKGCPGFYIHARFGVREELGYMNEDWLDRSSKEVISESCAFCVLRLLSQEYSIPQIDSAIYSFGYLAGWGSRDLKELKATLNLIRDITEIIFNQVSPAFSTAA